MRTIITLTAASLSLATAQVTNPQPQPGASVGGGNVEAGNAPEQPKLGEDLPFFNPSTELITWNGQTFAARDNAAFSARLEKYLSTPPDESEEARRYRENIKQILDYLLPSKTGGVKMSKALALLPEAAEFAGDARICDSLTQAIYVAIQSKNDVSLTKELQQALRAERKRIIRNSEIVAQKTKFHNEGEGKRVRVEGTGTSSPEYINMQKRLVEIEALLKGNQTKSEIRTIQAKTEYQALIVQLFIQRRFEHVIMAARFYSQIWKDGDSKMRFDKNSKSARFFSEGAGFSPTVSTLETLANEAITDVDRGIQSFKYLADKNELKAATDTLTGVYVVGEFLPAVTTLDLAQKRKIQLFVRKQIALAKSIEAKDYAEATRNLKDLDEMTSDFEGSAAKSVIAGNTRGSDMAVRAAKLALASGDVELAKTEIQKAYELWPLNPKVSEFDQMIDQGTQVAAGRNDFDRLISQDNKREIFNRRFELGPTVQADPQRNQQFQTILTEIQEIEGAIIAATGLAENGQTNAAWEQLYTLRDRFPNDPKLNGEIVTLSSKVGPFSNALEKAREMENRPTPQTASAVSWYLKARALSPGSKLANDGLQRTLEAAFGPTK